MKFTHTLESGSSSARLHIAGDLDYATTDELVAVATGVLSTHPGLRDLRLDFVDLTFCDSAGLSGLLTIHRRASQAGVSLHLDHRPPHLDRVLEITGLLEHFTIDVPATASSEPSSATDETGETEIG